MSYLPTWLLALSLFSFFDMGNSFKFGKSIHLSNSPLDKKFPLNLYLIEYFFRLLSKCYLQH